MGGPTTDPSNRDFLSNWGGRHNSRGKVSLQAARPLYFQAMMEEEDFGSERRVGHCRQALSHGEPQCWTILWAQRCRPGTPRQRPFSPVEVGTKSREKERCPILESRHQIRIRSTPRVTLSPRVTSIPLPQIAIGSGPWRGWRGTGVGVVQGYQTAPLVGRG